MGIHTSERTDFAKRDAERHNGLSVETRRRSHGVSPDNGFQKSENHLVGALRSLARVESRTVVAWVFPAYGLGNLRDGNAVAISSERSNQYRFRLENSDSHLRLSGFAHDTRASDGYRGPETGEPCGSDAHLFAENFDGRKWGLRVHISDPLRPRWSLGALAAVSRGSQKRVRPCAQRQN